MKELKDYTDQDLLEIGRKVVVTRIRDYARQKEKSDAIREVLKGIKEGTIKVPESIAKNL